MTLRALIAGRAGWGKSTLLKALAWRWPGEVLGFDPTGDLRDGAPNWVQWLPPAATPEDVALALSKAPDGALALLDECPRLIAPWDTLQAPLVRVLDLARNFGLSVALACKRPGSLPPLIGDVTEVVCHGPYRTPSSREWLTRAGLDPDIAIPKWHWAVAAPDCEAEVTPARLVASALMDLAVP